MRRTELGIPGKVNLHRSPHVGCGKKEIQPSHAGSTCLSAYVSFCFLPSIPQLIHNTPSQSETDKPNSQYGILTENPCSICSAKRFVLCNGTGILGGGEIKICDCAIIVSQFIWMMGTNKGCLGGYNSACPSFWAPDFEAFVVFCLYIILLFQIRYGVWNQTSSPFHLPLPFSCLTYQY